MELAELKHEVAMVGSARAGASPVTQTQHTTLVVFCMSWCADFEFRGYIGAQGQLDETQSLLELSRVRGAITSTIARHDGPNHLGL